MPNTTPPSPDYSGLMQFLVQPLLDSPAALSIDCEQFNNNQRVWIRLAFEPSDKGRVFGRSGRNIQAIRTVLTTAATAAGQSLYLDIYDKDKKSDPSQVSDYPEKEERHKVSSRRSDIPKPSVKSRYQ
ncbi:MAG: KH domain-containing protein [Gomphosphaeria aponina SAG 52.96 = DSM 107014]|uniref:KH domain-containing protein n=1 Tax=Gomphosphaeria aponina SAG 52.96 = DSM 107014 TaxID=1521640 RepID=A0A941JU99_9CHRO|nr:KH domain-containing protein [Gomphosphaeria aponina SAG 52.96 = DSM 107014]